MATIPKHYHFIFGLKPQNEPFHIAYYLCLKSCIEVNSPEKISFYYENEPYGPWWDKIKPSLDLVKLIDIDYGFDESLYDQHSEGLFIKQNGLQYAHKTDFLRLKILYEQGGVYADMDTLFVKPYPEQLFESLCVLGHEEYGAGVKTLCNAVIFAQAKSEFIQLWFAQTHNVFDGTWNRHSCREAAILKQQNPQLLQVVDRSYFYHFDCTTQGLTDLLALNSELPDTLYSIHLWSHLWWGKNRTDFIRFHADMLTEQFIKQVDSSFNLIARRFLD